MNDLLLAFEHVRMTTDLILTHNRAILKYWYSVSCGLYETTINEKTTINQLRDIFLSPVVIDDDNSQIAVNFVRQHIRQHVSVAIVDNDSSLDAFYARLMCIDDTNYTIRFNARVFRLKEMAVTDESNCIPRIQIVSYRIYVEYQQHHRRVSFVTSAVLLHLLTRTMWSKQYPVPQPPPDTRYCRAFRPEQQHATISMNNVFRYHTPIDSSPFYIGSKYRADWTFSGGKAWDSGNCLQNLFFGGEVHLEENEDDYVVLIGVTRLSDKVLIHFANNHRLGLLRQLTQIRTFPFAHTRVLIYVLDEQVAYEYKPSVPIRPLLHYDNEIFMRPSSATGVCAGSTSAYTFQTASQSHIFTERSMLFRRLTPRNVLLLQPPVVATLFQMRSGEEFDRIFDFCM